MEVPETRYARSGDVAIAYQVTGEGPFDVVFVPGAMSNVELAWHVSSLASVFRSLGSFCRLIRFDKRGTGMSDRVAGIANLETRMDDVRAVMDAAGSQRAAIIGVSEGGPMSALFAATYPERCWALVLYATFARKLWAPDYPWGSNEGELRRDIEETERRWGTAEDLAERVAVLAPSADEADKSAWADMIRLSGSPGTAAALNRMNMEIDVRYVLPAIRVPTLVLNRSGEHDFIRGGSRYLTEHIHGARHVELAGADHALGSGESAPVLQEMQTFLEAAWGAAGAEEQEPDRVLATVLFTDIVGSSEQAATLGDRAWRELLERHHELVRRQLARFRGREVDTSGDGFFASFDGPARAIRCACAVVEDIRELGIDVRAGLHTGECELVDGKVAGIAVHTGARVASNASPGEVLVSQTVKDLVAGSGLNFQERGLHELKGIPGQWRLFAVER